MRIANRCPRRMVRIAQLCRDQSGGGTRLSAEKVSERHDISDYSVCYTLRETPEFSGQFKGVEPMRKFCGRFAAGTVACKAG